MGFAEVVSVWYVESVIEILVYIGVTNTKKQTIYIYIIIF